jgi:hypothetical protein
MTVDYNRAMFDQETILSISMTDTDARHTAHEGSTRYNNE